MSDRDPLAAWKVVMDQFGWDPVLPTGLKLGPVLFKFHGGDYEFTFDAHGNLDGSIDVQVICDGQEVHQATFSPPPVH